MALLLAIRETEARKMIGKLLTSTDKSIRKEALHSLWILAVFERSDKALPLLLEKLADPKAPYRGEIATTLASIHSSHLVPGFERFASDPDPEVREAVIWGLGRTRGEPEVKILVRALEDERAKVRAKAAKVLGHLKKSRLKHPAVIELPMALLVRRVADPEPLVRRSALEALEHWKGAEMPREVIDCIEDPDDKVRSAAISLLGRKRAPGSLPALLRALRWAARNSDLRSLVIQALAASGEAEAEAPIIARLQDKSYRVRRRAIQGLGTLWRGMPWQGLAPLQGDRSTTIEALVKALKDDNLKNRLETVRVLAALGASDAVPAIVEIVGKTKSSSRKRILKLLTSMKVAQAAPLFEEIYYDRHQLPDLRVEAGKGLMSLDLPTPGLGRIRRAMKLQHFQFMDRGIYTFGVAPLVTIGRTGLNTKLDLDGTGAFVIGALEWIEADWAATMKLTYAPLTERATGKHVGYTHFDLGMGLPDSRGDMQARARLSVGYSALFLDFDGGGRDTVGLGVFGRATLDMQIRGRWGLELFADAHGWVGIDSHGAHLAGATSLGASIICSF